MRKLIITPQRSLIILGIVFLASMLLVASNIFGFPQFNQSADNKSPKSIEINQKHPSFEKVALSDDLKNEVVSMIQNDPVASGLQIVIQVSDVPQKIQINAGGDKSWSYSFNKNSDSVVFTIAYNPSEIPTDSRQIQEDFQYILLAGLCEQIRADTQSPAPLHERLFHCESETLTRMTNLKNNSSSNIVSIDLI